MEAGIIALWSTRFAHLPSGPTSFRQSETFSRQFVQEHFALETVSAKLEKFLSAAAAEKPKFHVALADGLRTAAVWLKERRFITPSCGNGSENRL